MDTNTKALTVLWFFFAAIILVPIFVSFVVAYAAWRREKKARARTKFDRHGIPFLSLLPLIIYLS